MTQLNYDIGFGKTKKVKTKMIVSHKNRVNAQPQIITKPAPNFYPNLTVGYGSGIIDDIKQTKSISKVGDMLIDDLKSKDYQTAASILSHINDSIKNRGFGSSEMMGAGLWDAVWSVAKKFKVPSRILKIAAGLALPTFPLLGAALGGVSEFVDSNLGYGKNPNKKVKMVGSGKIRMVGSGNGKILTI